MSEQEYIYIHSSLTLEEEARYFADTLGLETRIDATTTIPLAIELSGERVSTQRRAQAMVGTMGSGTAGVAVVLDSQACRTPDLADDHREPSWVGYTTGAQQTRDG